ncbi:hypothetical protein QA601_04560 [Chitinispirillales bacterium ANBcel5]|uniref:hypothetical protein n=1 Tax=Cellulosispirillum alkaliphilum TaxID=3039283 RepID=UPI002A516144|nr:hypothetical protein [Chitinispirillales bacterium ANBcel5]
MIKITGLSILSIFALFIACNGSPVTNHYSVGPAADSISKSHNRVALSNTSVPSIFTDIIDSFPNYYQRDRAFGGFEYRGRVYCGPVSVSNAFMRLINNGHYQLFPRTSDVEHDQHQLITLLGSSEYFNTRNRGTSPHTLTKGLEKFFKDRGIDEAKIVYHGWRKVPQRFSATGVQVPHLNDLKEALYTMDGVLLNFGWYRYNPQKNEYERTGGHWVTFVGYGHNGIDVDPYSLIYRDSETRNRINDYVTVEKIDSGTITGNLNNLPHDAKGYYKFRATRSRVGIIDGAVAFKLPPARKPIAGNFH